MKAISSSFAAVLFTLAASAGLPALAQGAPAGGTAQCNPKQDPAACAREAGAARQEAARGGLTQPGAAADANATARCDALPAGQRADCEARMQGTSPGTTTSGSVMGGGVIRETVTTVPATTAPSR